MLVKQITYSLTYCLLLLAFLAPPLQAQIAQGTIVYEEHNDRRTKEERAKSLKTTREALMAHYKNDEAVDKAMEALKKAQDITITRELIFVDSVSVFRAVDPKDYQTQMQQGKRQKGPTVIQEGLSNHSYQNLRTNEFVAIRHNLEIPFRIEEELPTYNWEIQDSTATIAPFKVRLATTTKDGKHISAWFTEEIPLSMGPDEYCGLPGMILRVEEDGVIHYNFVNFNASIPDAKEFEKPKKGKKITREEFEKDTKEKREALQQHTNDNIKR
ncbi:MAG: GLPGLI family protein [Bernardetiaceae bacterium]|nr:GLPGLI family protein [Bernardetiaceae bacterium]